MINKDSGRYSYIDGLKGFAILGIVMTHTKGEAIPVCVGKIAYFGMYGVQMFFLISAFLTWKSLDNHKTATNKSLLWWYEKKLVAVAPQYYLALFIAFLIGGEKHSAFDLLTHIFFVNGFIPEYMNSILHIEWYLATLVIFWGIAPFVHKFIFNIKRAIYFWSSLTYISIGYMCVMSYTFFRDMNETEMFFWGSRSIVVELQVLSLGIVIYYLKPMVNDKSFLSFVCLSIGAYLCLGIMFNTSLYVISPLMVVAGGFALIMIGCSQHKVFFLENRLTCTLGRYSLGIYLFHKMILEICDKYDVFAMNSFYWWIVKYVFTIVAAFLIAFVIEHFVVFIRGRIVK